MGWDMKNDDHEDDDEEDRITTPTLRIWSTNEVAT